VLAKRQANLAISQAGEPVDQNADAPSTPAPAVRFLRSIWRRRLLVAFLTALALLPAIVYIRLVTPLYTSASTILVGPTGATNLPTNARSRAAGDPATAEKFAAQRELITSTPVLAAALAAPSVKDCDPVRNHHDMIDFLKRTLTIESPGANLLRISIASTDPDDATCIIAAVVQAYSQFVASLRHHRDIDATATLRARRATLQTEFAKDSADLLRFGEDHHVGGGDVVAASQAELKKLADALDDAHIAAVQAKSASDELGRALADNPQLAGALQSFEKLSPATGRPDSDDEDLIRHELLALKATQADLAQRLMPGHPSLVKIQQRIADLDLQQDAAIQRRAAATAQHEADLQRAYDQEQKRILDQTTQQAEYDRRSADLAAMQRNISDLDQRIESVASSETSDVPGVTILDPARASLEPTSPDRQRILLVAVAGGFACSCLLAAWLERGRAARMHESGTTLNLPVLAELPALPKDFGPIGRGERSLLNGGPELDEVFAGLHAVIEGAKMRGRGVIALITSPSRGDGKSTLASNLAVFLAQTRKRVLLVDADLRTQSLAEVFGIGNATGLATLLEAEISIPITAIHHTGTPSLDLIPSGPVSRNPAELLNSQRFVDVLGDLAERYDYVIIDSPATVTFTDARTISAFCDLTMMVIRTDRVSRRLIQIARDGLTTIGANLSGIVLNSGQAPGRSMELRQAARDRGLPQNRAAQIARAEAPPRSLSGLIVAAARAVDLVRAPTHKQRLARQRLLPNQRSKSNPSSPRSNGRSLRDTTV
jgi:succinoglycan biosynthesis transport protein ExoP